MRLEYRGNSGTYFSQENHNNAISFKVSKAVVVTGIVSFGPKEFTGFTMFYKTIVNGVES